MRDAKLIEGREGVNAANLLGTSSWKVLLDGTVNGASC